MIGDIEPVLPSIIPRVLSEVFGLHFAGSAWVGVIRRLGLSAIQGRAIEPAIPDAVAALRAWAPWVSVGRHALAVARSSRAAE